MQFRSSSFSRWWGRWGGLTVTVLAIAVVEMAAKAGWRFSLSFLPLALVYAAYLGGWRRALPAAGLVLVYLVSARLFPTIYFDLSEEPLEQHISRLVVVLGVAALASVFKHRADQRLAASEARAALAAQVTERARAQDKLQQSDARATALGEANARLEREIADRRQAEAALLASEARLRAFLHSGAIVAWIKDESGRYVFLSDNHQQRFQVRFADWQGKTDFEVWPREIAEQFRRSDLAALESERATEAVERAVNPDGSSSWWLATKFVFRDAAGNRFIGGLGVDVTSRRRAEQVNEALIELGARLNDSTSAVEAARAVLKAADSLWQWDAAAVDLYVAETGLMEELLNFDVVNGERREFRMSAAARPPTPVMRRVIERGAELVLREAPLTPEPGAERFGDTARLSASIMRVPLRRDGRPVGVIAIHSYTPKAYTAADLRIAEALADYCGGALERIRTAEALRRSEERLSYALRGASDGLWDWNLETNEVLFSPRWKEMVGLTDSEVENRFAEWEQRVHPEDLPAALEAISAAREGRTPRYQAEFRLRHKEGHWVEILSRGTLVRDAAGRPVRMVGTHVDITARKRAEKALAESEQRFRTLAESSPVGIFQTDPAGNCIYVNRRWCELTGLSAAAAAGRGWEDALHPEDRERVAREWYEAAARRADFAGEYRYQAPDGSVRWVLGSSVPLRDGAGRVCGHLGTVADITARKAAEDALRASESRFRTLAEFAPVGIFMTNARGENVYVNERWRQLTGRPPGEAMGSGWLNAVHPEDRSRVLAERDAAWAAGLEFDGQYRYLRPDGTIRWVHTHSVAIHDAGGTLTGHMGTIIDVTERRQFELALREREARLSMIYQSVSDPLFLAREEPDGGFRFLSANRAFFDVMGFQETDVIGRRAEKFLPAAAAAAFKARARECITTGRTVQYEETLHLPAGRRTGLFTVTPIADSGGRFNQLLGVMHDLTASRRLERQLLEISDRERARIGQDLHDDLCQQLWGTELAAKILRDQLAARNAGEEAAQAEKIAGLLNAAISRAKDIARGLVPHDLRRDNLAAVLEGFATVATDLFRVPVEVACPAQFTVRDDATAFHLFRIVQEAVTNAGKHARARHIHVSVVEGDGCVTVSVRDDGLGLPENRPANGGLGRETMAYRSRLIGATLSVTGSPGGGTEVRCVFVR
jgi:PAS domain S-box-containing protein